MNRRSFLVAAAGVGASVSLAGCSSSPPGELADAAEDPAQLPVPTLGSGDVTLDVYEDFGCGGCHHFQQTMFPPIEEFLIDEGVVTYRHRDYPIPAHDRSFALANAARAVQDDTRTDADPNGAFFDYKARVFADDDWSDGNLAAIAEGVGADPDAVTAALEDGTYYPTLAADWQRGTDDGVDSTPTVLVDGSKVEDTFNFQEIAGEVENAR